jgi:hypothetical protein
VAQPVERAGAPPLPSITYLRRHRHAPAESPGFAIDSPQSPRLPRAAVQGSNGVIGVGRAAASTQPCPGDPTVIPHRNLRDSPAPTMPWLCPRILGSPANSVLNEGACTSLRSRGETMDSHPWCSASCLLACYRSSHALSRSRACGPPRISSLSRLARARVRPPVQRVDRALGGSTAIIYGSFVTCRRMGDP